MANVCNFCGKSRMSGNNVSHSHRKTRRVFHPNIQGMRALVNGVVKRVKVCTRCLRSGKVVKPVKAVKPD
ncbi:MAG: 50S ribosomal protein L28 [Nitrospirota bacterium]|nr:50S ribosomal protein L28 [Nitrospirota bacterium]